MRRIIAVLALPILLLLGICTATTASADVVDGGTLASGTAVTGTTSVVGRDIQYTFAATAGAHVTFDVTASSWGTGTARLSFANPSGTLFTYCTLANLATFCDLTPNVTGAWKVTLDPQTTAVGSATFTFANDQAKGLVAPLTPLTTSLTTKGQNATYTFAATSGTLTTFNISAANFGTGSAYLLLYTPTGAFSTFCTVNTTSYCGFTPNATGTWKIVLDPQAASVGSTTFTYGGSTYGGDQDKGALTSGTPITTTISTPGQDANYTFAATSGAHVTFDVTASNWPAGLAQLHFFNPAGAVYNVCNLDNSGSFCEITPNVTGTWKVKLDPLGSAVGSATFTFANDQAKGLVSPATPLTTSITTTGQNATYTFAATSGTLTTFNISAANFGTGNAFLLFYTPSGTFSTFCAVTTTDYCGFTPNVTGTWKIELDPHAFSLGSTTFTYATTGGSGGTGDQDKGALTAGTPITTTIGAPSQDANYTFNATNGAHVSLDVTATNWGTGGAQLDIFTPAGVLYTYCDLANAATFCDFTPNVGGTWKVKLDPQGSAVGSTTFTLANDQAKGALTALTPISTSITTKGQNANYTFAGTSGALTTFDITAASFGTGSAYLYFYTPTGVFSTFCTVNTTDYCGFTPNATGTWKIVLDPQGASTGSATLLKE